MNERYRIGEFARLTGVTIRALQYYDRIGLLRPQGRSEAGYRWYAERELVRLQQIVTLKELGFTLDSIARFLDADDFEISSALDKQIELFWDELTAAFTQNDAALERSLGTLYADPENRAKAGAAMPGLPAAWRFIERARAARKSG